MDLLLSICSASALPVNGTDAELIPASYGGWNNVMATFPASPGKGEVNSCPYSSGMDAVLWIIIMHYYFDWFACCVCENTRITPPSFLGGRIKARFSVPAMACPEATVPCLTNF